MYHRDVTEAWNGSTQSTLMLTIKVVAEEEYEAFGPVVQRLSDTAVDRSPRLTVLRSPLPFLHSARRFGPSSPTARPAAPPASPTTPPRPHRGRRGGCDLDVLVIAVISGSVRAGGVYAPFRRRRDDTLVAALERKGAAVALRVCVARGPRTCSSSRAPPSSPPAPSFDRGRRWRRRGG